MASDIMKQGYVKFQSKNLGVWKKRWLILRAQTLNGPVRLEKYKDETSATCSGKCRTFILNDVLNLYRLPDSERRYAIHIDVDQYESVQFSLESEAEAKSWMKKIEGEITEAHESRSSFSVYMMKNPKLFVHGKCTLDLTKDSIRLLNHRDEEIVNWPITKLRRYAVERNIFKIEAGRSCTTGEGEFVFECDEAQDIYDRVHRLTASMASNNNNKKKEKEYKTAVRPTDASNKTSEKMAKCIESQSKSGKTSSYDTTEKKSIFDLSAAKTAYGNRKGNNQENDYTNKYDIPKSGSGRTDVDDDDDVYDTPYRRPKERK